MGKTDDGFRRSAPALLGMLLASCSFSYSANVPEDDPLEPLLASTGPPVPSVVLVTETQLLLADLGYDPGPADGIVGPRTYSAIAAFQDDYGPSAPLRVSEAVIAQLRYVSCVHNRTADAVSFNDCDTPLQSASVQAPARLPSSSDFVEASEIVSVGMPIIAVSGDYGRLGYRPEDSDEGGSGGDAVASAGDGPSSSSSGSTQGSGGGGAGEGGEGGEGG